MGVYGELCSTAATLDGGAMTKMTETTTPPRFVTIAAASCQHNMTTGLFALAGGFRCGDLGFEFGKFAI
jgi:hypothetical protein